MKKYQSLLLSFFIPIGLFIIATFLTNIYPFGEKILPMLDGYTQHPGFLNAFKEFILHNQSILYSFKGITGFNLYAVNIYYTFNLTNLLCILFKTSNIINFYTFIIPVKIGLASVTMNIFLNYLKKDKNNFIYSICYGLSAYNLLYYLNYMWFDSVIMLPLVMLSIEKLFKENKGYLYTIFLALTIIFNFYIGYMICIFSLVFFTYKLFNSKNKKNYIIKFIIHSLLAGLIASVVLIPVIYELMQGKNQIFFETDYFKFDIDFINIFYKLTIGSFLNGDLEYGTPNVYVSMFIYINSILYFFNKRITNKDKIISAIVFIFFLISMSFNLLDFSWQMFQRPIYYPVRYSFLFDFYLIFLAFKNYSNYEISSKKSICVLIIIIILSLVGFFTSGNLLDKINIPAKLIYLIISYLFLFYYVFIMNNKYYKKYIWLVIIIELFVNLFITLKNNGNEITISEYKDKYISANQVLKQINDNPLERIAFDEMITRNNGLLLNYNDINFFSSVRNKKSLDILKDLMGINVYDDCSTKYFFNNPITNSLLNIKYYVSEDKIDYYKEIGKYNNNYIYLNEDTSSIGFITNDLSKIKLTDNYLQNINSYVKTINQNDKNILTESEVSDKNVNCSKIMCITNGNEPSINYKIVADKDYFIYIKNDYPAPSKNTIYTVNHNGKTFIYSNNYPIFLKKKDVIYINIKPDEFFKDYDFHVYKVDFKIYQQFIENINKNKLQITEYQNDAHFKGTINLETDSFLYTSISNDKGWNIKVDNNNYNIQSINDGLIGINLKKGFHTIEFNYFPPGLKIGLIISISSLSLLSILFIINKHQIK